MQINQPSVTLSVAECHALAGFMNSNLPLTQYVAAMKANADAPWGKDSADEVQLLLKLNQVMAKMRGRVFDF